METEPTHKSVKDAFIYDLMGDVGRLHDLIKALPEALEKSTAPTLGAIALAVRESKDAIQKAGEAQGPVIAKFAAQEKNDLRDVMTSTAKDAAGQEIGKSVGKVEQAAGAVVGAAADVRRGRWLWLAAALAVGLLGGALGVYSSHVLYGKQQAEQAAFGRALGTVWDSLDTKTKARIQAARNSQ